MTKKVHAVFDGKVFRPEEPVDLPVNGRYVLRIEAIEEEAPPQTLKDVESDAAYDLASLAVKTGIADLAAKHDHYLYGSPKKKNRE